VQRQWEYTFDSIGDPILVHDRAGRILRSISGSANSWGVRERSCRPKRHGTPPRPKRCLQELPLLRGCWRGRRRSRSMAARLFPGLQLHVYGSEWPAIGTVHVLKDITERKRARKNTVRSSPAFRKAYLSPRPRDASWISTMRFLRMTGYEDREELLEVDIPAAFYANSSDRERLRNFCSSTVESPISNSKCGARTAKYAPCWNLPSRYGMPPARDAIRVSCSTLPSGSRRNTKSGAATGAPGVEFDRPDR